MTAPTDQPERSRSPIPTSFGLLAFSLGLMWAVEVIDTFVLSDRLQSNGILPRRLDGLDGVLWAPFLHGQWNHLIANSLPFAVLGGLVAIWGTRRWLGVTVIIIVVGGLATWAFAGFGNHIGASGVVFGYFGFLIGAVLFERKWWPLLPATIAILVFGSAMLGGVVPTDGVSWEGHLFGALAGFLAAKLTAPKRLSAVEAAA